MSSGKHSGLAVPLVPLAGALLLGVALTLGAHLALAACAYVSLVPLLCISRRLRFHWAAVAGLLHGTAVGVILGTWFYETLRENGLDPVTAGIWLVGAAAWVKGVPTLVLAAAAALVRGRTRAAALPATAAAVDVAATLTVPGVPWALLGHSQIDVYPVAAVASWGGVPLVTALVVAVNVMIQRAWAIPSRPTALALAGAPLLLLGALFVVGPPSPRQAASGTYLLLVQPDIPFDQRWEPLLQRTHLHELLSLTHRGLARGPVDLVVWPETALTRSPDEDPLLHERLGDELGAIGTSSLVGIVAATSPTRPNRYRNRAVLLDPSGEVQHTLDKRYPIPVFEAEPTGPVESALARFVPTGMGAARVVAGQAGVPLG